MSDYECRLPDCVSFCDLRIHDFEVLMNGHVLLRNKSNKIFSSFDFDPFLRC